MVVHAPLPGGEGGRHDDAEADVVAVHVVDGGVGGAVVVVPVNYVRFAPRVAEEMRVSVDEGDASATTLAITLAAPLSPAAPFSLAGASLDEDQGSRLGRFELNKFVQFLSQERGHLARRMIEAATGFGGNDKVYRLSQPLLGQAASDAYG